MPTLAKFQKSKRYPVRQEDLGNRNMFDRSYDHVTTFTLGKLVPIFWDETLPGDTFYIRAEYMFRFAPLYLPIMTRVNFSCDYFFIPNRIMWPELYPITEDPEVRTHQGWETFITNPFHNSLHPTVELELFQPDVDRRYELAMYLGVPTNLGVLSTLKVFNVNAFPFSAYYMVWDQYYRNDQVQDPIWFPLIQGNNTDRMPKVGREQVDDYLACQYRNWNRDLWTSCTPTPQLGETAVQIPLIKSFEDMQGITPNSLWRRATSGDPEGAGDLFTDASGFTVGGGGGGAQLYYDPGNTAATIAELRYHLMLQEYLERLMRAGDRYSDNMLVMWNTDPYAGVIQVPQFIGSKRGRVVVSEVMSTAETATLKVGNYAGQALLLESKTDTIEYYCKEHGIVLGIISCYPDSSYMQGMEKAWWRELTEDYAFEQFALIGDQAVLNREINIDPKDVPTDPNYNEGVFGYNRRYYEYTYRNDMYTGLMRTTFISFHLGRMFDPTFTDPIALNSEFVKCKPDVTRVFQVAEGEDEIYAHVYNDVKVMRRLPKNGIPAV